MIELKGLWKSFEGRDVLKDINATFENGKTNLRTEWFGKNRIDEVYRWIAHTGTG